MINSSYSSTVDIFVNQILQKSYRQSLGRWSVQPQIEKKVNSGKYSKMFRSKEIETNEISFFAWN